MDKKMLALCSFFMVILVVIIVCGTNIIVCGAYSIGNSRREVAERRAEKNAEWQAEYDRQTDK